MPTIMVNMLEGRTHEQKKEFSQNVTNAAVKDLGVPPQAVTVIFNEVKETNLAQGGVLKSDQK
jgi:4-oxalocrotonate tautomerase